MASNEYHFTTHWRVQATIAEVAKILGDPLDLPRWWPAVYLDVQQLPPVGDRPEPVYDMYTKGRLPYTLRWQFRSLPSHPPHTLALEAWGDFVGQGIWTLTQDGEWADIVYDWRIQAEKPLLRYFSFLLKPIFSANHEWAMARGLESLQAELMRRHANQ
ncbi:MAG: SRPBCC family protein [Caldilineaceae bacterium]|nr:SRPBCC family protein [Caldilineaceae bacterium]